MQLQLQAWRSSRQFRASFILCYNLYRAKIKVLTVCREDFISVFANMEFIIPCLGVTTRGLGRQSLFFWPLYRQKPMGLKDDKQCCWESGRSFDA